MTRSRSLLILLLIFAPLACHAQPNTAQPDEEQILSFKSLITVNPDTSATVQETIRVRSTGDKIIHGIYRDLCFDHREFFRTIDEDCKVLSATCDGRPEKYSIGFLRNGTRISLGNYGACLVPGEHTYVLTYRVRGWLSSSANRDELRWKAIDSQRQFCIRKAIIIIKLPKSIQPDMLKLTAHTDTQEANQHNYSAHIRRDGCAEFVTTKALLPGEALTVAVSWPKGLIKGPPFLGRLLIMLRGIGGAIYCLIEMLVLLAYYLIVWMIVGREPPKSTIVPLYEPPNGLSPAVMRYLRKGYYDNKALAAAIVNMAVKGYLSITKDKGVYVLHKSNASIKTLSREEAIIARKLLGKEASFSLHTDNHSRISEAIDRFSMSMPLYAGEKEIISNRAYLIVGALLTLVPVSHAAIAFGSSDLIRSWAVDFGMCACTVGLFAAIHQVIRVLNHYPIGGNEPLFNHGADNVFAIVLMCIALFWELGFIAITWSKSSPFDTPICILGGVMFAAFYYPMRAASPQRRKLLSQIEGFRMYLSVAEGDMISDSASRMETHPNHEKYLAYAMALDVEETWANEFSGILTALEDFIEFDHS